MNRPRRNYSRGVTRAQPVQSDGKTFLIVVEGKETEQQYFDGLRRKLELKSAHVEVVHPGVTDPANIVNAAIKFRDERIEASKRGFLVPYDEVWIVLDREGASHPRGGQLPMALKTAEEEGIQVALSDPAFEFWLVLHFEYTTKGFASADAVIRHLKKHHIRDYAKNALPVATLLPRLAAAVKHAERGLRHHEMCNGDGNPSTRAHSLVISLNASAASVFRLL